MKRLLALLLLGGCATDAPPTVAAPAALNVVIREAQSCTTLDRSLLKPIRKAEGSIAFAPDVATERGGQVDQLNAHIEAIGKALAAGCIE